MISLHSSHVAHSPCIREGCWRRVSTSSGFTGAMRGFLLNQAAIEGVVVYGRRLPASTKPSPARDERHRLGTETLVGPRTSLPGDCTQGYRSKVCPSSSTFTGRPAS